MVLRWLWQLECHVFTILQTSKYGEEARTFVHLCLFYSEENPFQLTFPWASLTTTMSWVYFWFQERMEKWVYGKGKWSHHGWLSLTHSWGYVLSENIRIQLGWNRMAIRELTNRGTSSATICLRTFTKLALKFMLPFASDLGVNNVLPVMMKRPRWKSRTLEEIAVGVGWGGEWSC